MSSVKKAFARADRLFGSGLNLLAALSAVFIAGFVVLMLVDFTLRTARLGGLIWLNDLLEYALYITVIAAAPWLLRLNGHVRLDIADQVLSDRMRAWLAPVTEMIGAVICFAMAWLGAVSASDAFSAGMRAYKVLVVDTGWLLAAFSVGMTLLGIEFIIRFANAISLTKEVE